jgi:hypothetical protein
MGIMLYKLYASYTSWKNASAFSSTLVSKKTGTFSSKVDNSNHLPVSKIYINVSRSAKPSTVNDEVNNAFEKKTSIKKLNIQTSNKVTAVEKKSSAILNDYIGEFFAEHQKMDIEPFRVSGSQAIKEIQAVEKKIKNNVELTSSLKTNENKFDDEVIKVEPLFIVSDSLSRSGVFDENKFSKTLEDDAAIPILNELSELESDTFITVASINNEIKNGNKIMSDKVVLAMLDEAKLVCAS